MPPFITFNHVIPRIPNSIFTQPIDWQINKGEIWAVVGNNGSGKSMLSQVIRGQYVIDSGFIEYHFLSKEKQKDGMDLLSGLERYIRIVSMDSTYSMADYRQAYYQQRFNSTDASSAPFVHQLFHPENYESELTAQIVQIFNLEKLMDRRLIHLSSGELRKFMIARVVLLNPKLIIFDNPFIGLDLKSQDSLNDIFLELNQLGIQLIFLVPSYNEMPQFTTHILEIDKGIVKLKGKIQNPISKISVKNHVGIKDIDWKKIPSVPFNNFDTAVNMENVDISYGNNQVCEAINWKVKKGEKWALLGPNGSGKSTLLSCIFADNPVAYAKNLVLFDRKRGTGESIWEIKQRIGFTSSEMHLYYRQNISCIEVIESGFYDSIGLHRKCSEKQRHIAQFLLHVLSLDHLSNCPFTRVSSGEQRILLFARSLVKNPDLLILDEPYHGLDASNKQLCREIVDSFCNQPFKTLIYVTHHREEIPSCVDKVLELK
jgi:molybdate transport system ATP-binding protein